MENFPFSSTAALRNSEDCQFAWKCAAIAGKILQENFFLQNEVEQKGHGDFVLSVDKAIDREVRGLIARQYPNDGILSEESAALRGRSGRTWIVDPLDATTAYMLKSDLCAPSFMIALAIDERVILGLVYCPLVNTVFLARAGVGAYVSAEPIGPRRLEVNRQPVLQKAWVECNRYSDVRFESSWFRELSVKLRSPGGAPVVTSQVPHSSVSCWMCLSKPDAVIHDNNSLNIKQNVWDLAAPSIFVEEAGGVVLNAVGDRLNPFHPEPAIFAASRELGFELVSFAAR
jgi:myo-inositol-1(or 4)-monophosphatase